ncbi:MAG: AbrB/MazE/SpoVT family DNA-binding domain-containing protein [Candidatus Dojkabacteria bacterium]
MFTHITITSQGQISIPAKFRRILGLKKQSKVIMELQDERIIIRPERDLMQLDGIISDRAFPYSPEKINTLEKKALEKWVKEKHTKK